MRSITRCPACQTQFFVTEAQLNKHGGMVRCGQCLHVFNAKTEFDQAATAAAPAALAEPTATVTADQSPADAATGPAPAQLPAIDHAVSTDSDSFDTDNLEPVAEVVELSASDEEIEAFKAEIPEYAAASSADTAWQDADDHEWIDDDNSDKTDAQQASDLNDITKLTYLADNQERYFSDLMRSSKRGSTKAGAARWPWFLGTFVLLLTALAQSIYFLRDDIAIYYPQVKPYLIQACQQLGCSINLPRQIELIVIDDSDMQEDEQYAGLMRFSSSLINKAGFSQAYPNLELTLTDVDDNPVLRRIFKPSEYLPVNTDVALGFQAGAEIKIRLAITTSNVSAAGYRVYVTY